MKKLLLPAICTFAVFLTFATTAYAAAFLTAVGGTGTTTPSGILYGDNGATNHLNTVTVGSGCTFIAGVLACAGTGGTSAFPFTPTNYGVSTSTTIGLLNGLLSTASSTFTVAPIFASLASQGCLGTDGAGKVQAGTCTGGGGSFPFTLTNYGVSTSTTVGFLNGILSTASSTFTVAPILSSIKNAILSTNGVGLVVASTSIGVNYLTGILPIGNGGTGLSAVGASSTVLTTNGSVAQWNKLATSQLTNDSGFITSASTFAFPFIPTSYGVSTSTTVGFLNGLLSTASSTFTTAPVFSSVTNAILGTNGAGLVSASTSIGVNYLTGTLPIGNGGTGLSSIGASSTVLTTNGSVAQWNKLATSQLTNDSGFITSAVTAVTGTYPIISSGGNTPAISLAFGTTTSNLWAGTQTFTNAPVLSSIANSILAVNGSGTIIASTSIGVNLLTGVLGVANGGTGAATLTGLLQGNGTSAITGVTGTAGQFPYYNGTNTLLATSTLFLATTGNVGIATTSPYALFSIGNTGGIGFTLATSTFNTTGGINITNGCYAINGTCLSSSGGGGSGTVTSVATTYPITGGTITTSGTLALAFGTTTSNLWAGTQTFTNAPIFSSLNGLLQGNGASAITGVTGTIGQFPYYNGTNTLLATSSVYLSTASNFGIGTSTTPYKTLSVAGSGIAVTDAANAPALVVDTTVGTGPQLAVFATTSTSSVCGGNTGLCLFSIDQYGHEVASTTYTPVLTSCGTGPALGVGSNDVYGNFTVGSAASGCTVTFGNPRTSTPVYCVVTPRTGSVVNTISYTCSTASIIMTETGATGVYDYRVEGQ